MQDMQELLTEYRNEGRIIQARIDEVRAGLPYLRGAQRRIAERRIDSLTDLLANVTYGSREMNKYAEEGEHENRGMSAEV